MVYDNLEKVLFELLKYENIFDSRFYTTTELELDGIDITANIFQEGLTYFKSKNFYTYISLKYDDNAEYKSLFQQWNGMCDNLGIVHQMYLYSWYSSDITPDVRLALLLQIFESIIDMLYDNGKISLSKMPYITTSEECNNCGHIVSVNIKNKYVHFQIVLKLL